MENIKYGWEIVGGHRSPTPVDSIETAKHQIGECRSWNPTEQWKDNDAIVYPLKFVRLPCKGWGTWIPAGEAFVI